MCQSALAAWTLTLAANVERFCSQLRGRPVGGVVILCGPGAGEPE